MAEFSLQKYLLSDVQDTKEEIGRGSYSTVVKMKFRGLTCAGKRLHQLLTTAKDRELVMKRFADECDLLSQLRHPNIVQFIGVHDDPNSGYPVLIMEYMEQSLANLVDQQGPLPLAMLVPILRDVGLGLAYLHGFQPPIVHRDLSANNVLLTNKGQRAKISDLGVARLLSLTGQDDLTMCPGVPLYMAPEALLDNPNYDSKMDCFAVGVLIIHALSGQWPFPTAPTVFNAETSSLVAVSEYNRRAKYIESILPNNPLLELSEKCLNNNPVARPTACDIVNELDTLDLEEPLLPIHHDQLLKDQLEDSKSKLSAKETEMVSLSLAYSTLEVQTSSQVRQLELAKSEMASLHQALKPLQDLVSTQRRALEEKEAVISTLTAQTSKINSLFSAKSQGPPITFEWTRCGDLPLANHNMKAAYCKGVLCVGGGYSREKENRFKLFKSSNLWDWAPLPDAPITACELIEHRGTLLMVGGLNTSGVKSDVAWACDVLENDMKQASLPQLPIKLHYTGTVTINSSWIVTIGGFGEPGNILSDCYMLKIGEGQWIPGPPLPKPLYSPSCLFMNDKVYVMGGYTCANPLQTNKEVFCCNWNSKKWHTLCRIPFDYATYASVGGSLSCIGRSTEDGKQTTSLMVYSEKYQTWSKLSDLPDLIKRCTSATLPTGEVIVIGSNESTGSSSCVFKGRLMFY